MSDNVKIPARDLLDNDHHREAEPSENNETAGETSVGDTGGGGDGDGPQDFVIDEDPQSGEISSSDNQKDITEVSEEITDSDSGIYSLYDNVANTKLLETSESESQPSLQDFDRSFVTDAFYESRTLRDLLNALQQRSLRSCSYDLVENLRKRQDALRQYLANLELEKVEVNDSLINFQDKISQMIPDQTFQKKLQSLLKQIDIITNLIFGIEMKIEKCSYNAFTVIDSESWSSRLAEALQIKTCHCESLKTLLKSKLDVENQLWLEEKILVKQRIICHLKLIKSEIYCNEMQIKILFM